MTYSKWKSFFDFTFAFVLLILSFPVLVLISLFIKLEDSTGPVIFRQTRVGKDEKLFTLYKFRSMKVEEMREGVKLTDSERIFRTGRLIRKTSLDELPQLLNILKGEMSFIGPRPLPDDYLPFYTFHENKRHTIKPGISGYAQVNGRNKLSWERKFEMDVYYTQNVSFLLDLKILLLTIKKVFMGSDVVEYNYETDKELTDYRTAQRNLLE